MSDTVIDTVAVRDVARGLRASAEALRPAAALLRALPALSDRSPAGPALREFAAVWGRAGQILAESATQLASATGDAAGIWCTVDQAVAGPRVSAS